MGYHDSEISEVLRQKHTSLQGLTNAEAEQRLLQFGENKLTEEKRASPFALLLRQFNEFVIYILLAAALISFLVKEFLDGYVILAILVFNACLGFFQEYKAERAVALLKQLTTLKARVLRSGKTVEILSTALVPGDIVVLEAGDKVPADLRIVESNNLETNEAALTGESMPCHKQINALKKLVNLAERSNMLYSGTIIVRGTGKAVVVNTAMQTEIGKIAQMVQDAGSHTTPLQHKLKELGTFLGYVTLGICLLVFLFGLVRGNGFFPTLLTALSLAVAAIPEGLPAVVTICLALSVQRMIKKNALIKRLKSIETLGSVTVICSDKTGTLTQNEMTVKKIYVNEQLIDVTGQGYTALGTFLFQEKTMDPRSLNRLLTIAASCNNATEDTGDPTEKALLFAAKKAGIEKQSRIGEIPFETEKRFMATLHRGMDYYKGAPEVILDMCQFIEIEGRVRRLIDRDRAKILKMNEQLAQQALRVLAMAYKQSGQMYFVGLMGMIDPPKDGVKEALALCQQAGIRSIMITGDHPLTAKAVANMIGLHDKVITGMELDEFTDDEMKHIVQEHSIFARASSAHKVKILKALQANGEIVAMTGDGINDAPALKNADVGVAMSLRGTDVSRDTADMVLVDDHYGSIVAAVEQGRIVYDNIKRFVNYLLSANAAEVSIILFALILHLPLPLLPLQILWINLMTDSWPALALGVEQGEKEIMQRKPRDPKEPFLKGIVKFIVITAIIGTLITLSLFWIEYDFHGNYQKATTMALTAIIVFEIFRAYSCKSAKPFGNLFSNKWMHLAALLSLSLHMIILYTPLSLAFKTVALSLSDWIRILITAFVGYSLLELSKVFVKQPSSSLLLRR